MNKPAECILDSAASVNEIVDAALYIWASMEDCSGSITAVKCAIDVSSVVKSVLGILKLVLKAVNECATIKTLNHKCAAESFLLGEGIACLAMASVGIVQKCTPRDAPAPLAPLALTPTATCAGFFYQASMTLRPQPERLDCSGICTAVACCLLVKLMSYSVAAKIDSPDFWMIGSPADRIWHGHAAAGELHEQ